MSGDKEYVQWGGSMSLDMLDDEEEEEIVNTMREAGLRVGSVPGKGCYNVRAWDDDE